MSNIRISKEAAETLGEGIRFGSGIELPFPVIYFQVRNGDAALEDLITSAPTRYFGGFQTDAEPIDALLENQGLELLHGMSKARLTEKKTGRKFETYMTRRLLLAPIGYRLSWYNSDTHERRPQSYTKGLPKDAFRTEMRGFRRHIQLLAYAGTKQRVGDGDVYSGWHPIVITAKGYQVSHISEALQSWSKHTAKVRAVISKEVGANIPAWCFYALIGTFGDDINQVTVGSGDNTSQITPIEAWLPDPVTIEQMEKLYVGEEMADELAGMREDAAEWLNAWGQGYKETDITEDESGAPEVEPEDIPF